MPDVTALGAEAPQITSSVLMLKSLGSVVDAAAALAARVIGDVDTRLEPLDADTRAAVLAVCDAVYTADYHTA